MNGIPRHIAIIMDGNGRWAEARGLPRWRGHAAGADAARRTARACAERGVETLTLYAFSSENWRRPEREIKVLFSLLEEHLKRELPELLREGVRFSAVGRRDRIPESSRRLIEEAERRTADGKRLHLRMAIDYGGRAEIAEAARRIAARAASGDLLPASITEETFAVEIGRDGVPDPDLLIRTGGEQRLSNFMLWQVSYAELYFTPVLWPDFDRPDLDAAIEDYRTRVRRYGAVTAGNFADPPGQPSAGVSG
ncbi:MAG: polyprenyl diphosphate synthase [Planctomycetota bacterium]|nr:polyprenyl diphosphate synthase [Planctomycetota bacterium]